MLNFAMFGWGMAAGFLLAVFLGWLLWTKKPVDPTSDDGTYDAMKVQNTPAKFRQGSG